MLWEPISFMRGIRSSDLECGFGRQFLRLETGFYD
jgi:hypothetical protein